MTTRSGKRTARKQTDGRDPQSLSKPVQGLATTYLRPAGTRIYNINFGVPNSGRAFDSTRLPPNRILVRSFPQVMAKLQRPNLLRRNLIDMGKTCCDRCPFWLFCSNNRWLFLVYLVVSSSTRAIYFPLNGHLCLLNNMRSPSSGHWEWEMLRIFDLSGCSILEKIQVNRPHCPLLKISTF